MNPQGLLGLPCSSRFAVTLERRRSIFLRLNIPGAGWGLRFSGIYVNKNVKLDDLHVYGFDYDYTLSHYSEHLQCLIYDLAKKHLVNEVWLLSLLGGTGAGWCTYCF